MNLREIPVCCLSLLSVSGTLVAAETLFGPVHNPEDQWRSYTGGAGHFAEFSAAGLNTVIGGGVERCWSLDAGKACGGAEARRKRTETLCARALSHGLGIMPSFRYCNNYGKRKEYALVHIDGTYPQRKLIDGLNAQYRRELEQAIAAEGRNLRDLPCANGSPTGSPTASARRWPGPGRVDTRARRPLSQCNVRCHGRGRPPGGSFFVRYLLRSPGTVIA